MELTLLGTGNPVPDPRRAGPSQVVRIGDDRVLVDCGSGTVRRLVQAGESPGDVHTVLITHMHSDHSIDLGHFLISRWIMRNDRPLTLAGPPGLRAYVDGLLRLLAWDIQLRNFDRHLSEEARRIDVIEVEDGWVLERDHWKVRAIRVEHYPVEHAFAFRLDGEEGSLAISGDTGPCERLAAAAAGVDILVHEVWLVSAREWASARAMPPEEAERYLNKLNTYHTSPPDVGRIARLADPRLLLLSHLGQVDTDEVRTGVLGQFSRAVVGHDLLKYDVRRALPL